MSDLMEEALAQAERARAEDEVPVGAVVVAPDGSIIGRGYNRRESDQDPLGHAELMAIREAAQRLGSWRLIDCTLVVTLEPCPMCLAACQQSRIRAVVYGAIDTKGGAISLGYPMHEDIRINHRFDVKLTPVEACSSILREFFREKRQKPTAPKKP